MLADADPHVDGEKCTYTTFTYSTFILHDDIYAIAYADGYQPRMAKRSEGFVFKLIKLED